VIGLVVLLTFLTACSGGDGGSDQIVNSGDNGGNTSEGPTNPGGDGGNTPTDPAAPGGDVGGTPTEPVAPGGDGGSTPTDPTNPGGGAGNTPTPLAYTGNTTAAIITASNAEILAQDFVAGSFIVPSVNPPARNSLTAESKLIDLRYSLRDGYFALNETEPCANGGTKQLTNNTIRWIGTFIIDFDSCREGFETVTGQVSFQVDEYDSLNYVPTDSTMNFTDLTIEGRSYNYTASGSIRIEDNRVTNNIEKITINIVTRNNITLAIKKLENMVLEIAHDPSSWPFSQSVTLNGRVFDSVHGYVDVATPEALFYNYVFYEYPEQQGALLLTGSFNRRLKIIPGSNEKVRLEIDSDGDSQFDQYYVYYWMDVGGELAPNEAPDVSSIAIQQNNPYTTDDLTVDESLILDPDADPIELSYVWYKNGVVLLGQTTHILPSDQHVKGDVISVEVIATDGTLASMGTDSVTTINSPPVISAGEFFSITFGEELRLNGSAFDADDDPMNYTWSITTQSYDGEATISDVNVLNPLISYFGQGEYRFLLLASDGESTIESRLIVTIAPMPLFSSYESIGGITGSNAVAIGDVNNDGLDDVVVATYSSTPEDASRVVVLLQDVSGGLSEPVNYSVGLDPTYSQLDSIAIADMNNDGRGDVVTSYENGVGVMLQNTQGTLDRIAIYALDPAGNSATYDIVAADFNGDELKDIAAIDSAGSQPSVVSIFLQNSNGTVNPPVSYSVPDGAIVDLAYGDLNNDGLNDIVVTNGAGGITNRFSILLQQADNTYDVVAPYNLENSLSSARAVEVGDVNGDSLDDVVVAYTDHSSFFRFAVFYQNAGGTLDTPINLKSFDFADSVDIADINGDGRKDIILGHSGNSIITVYLQNSDGTLMREQRYPFAYTHTNPNSMAIGDINGDGQNDIVEADGGGITILYHQ